MKAAANDASAIETFLESVPDVGHRQRLRKLMTCEVRSREDTGSQPPTMAKPMREEQFKEWAADKGGYASARIGKRHVVGVASMTMVCHNSALLTISVTMA